MNIMEKYLLTDANQDGSGVPKKDGTGKGKEMKKGGKVCYHCKNAPALPKRAVCGKCDKELEAWRNKKGKKESEK